MSAALVGRVQYYCLLGLKRLEQLEQLTPFEEFFGIQPENHPFHRPSTEHFAWVLSPEISLVRS